VLGIVALAIIGGVFLLVPPIPQDPAYHLFADDRALFGIPNTWNVLSNLPFLIVGLWGLGMTRRHRVCAPELLPAYVVFFFGILLTAFGSGYYHLDPDNDSLLPDRLPMTIGFAGLFAMVVGEFVSVNTGRRLVLPMLVAGIASVVYWGITEASGMGDLRPYALVQFLPMLLIVIILAVYRRASTLLRYFWLMMLCYVLAKIAEHFDTAIFAAGEFVSGHTLKHLFASATPAVLLYALTRRSKVESG
jgi:hypothetical protein